MEKEIMEAYPEYIQERLNKREEQRNREITSFDSPDGFRLVLDDLKQWEVGALKISFKGGTSELHGQIVQAATEWTEFGNIAFDFGYNAATGTYRQWHAQDDSHIRVGFGERGYWSFVGTDSTDPQIAPLGSITLNLQNFDRSLPNNWKGTVLHEFGHALGFHHEHQSPAGECDFNWEAVYDYLQGPPNNWSIARIDRNMRKLPARGLSFTPYDKSSIMHYSFSPSFFSAGAESPCYTPRNNTLSAGDKNMMADAYPFAPELAIANAERRKENLRTILSANDLSNEVADHLNQHLFFLKRLLENQ